MKRFDAADHFDRFAGHYDRYAFEAGAGLRAISERELSVVAARLGGVAGRRILDAGMGTGRAAGVLTDAGANVVGVDISWEMVGRGRRKAPRAVILMARLGLPLPFRDGSFDGALCLRVSKYVRDWDLMFAEFRRILRPGGVLVVEVANRRSAARWGYGAMPVHLATLSETRRLLADCSLRVVAVDRGTRIPFPIYRWARTPSRLRPIQALESAADVTIGRATGARSLVLTARAV